MPFFHFKLPVRSTGNKIIALELELEKIDPMITRRREWIERGVDSEKCRLFFCLYPQSTIENMKMENGKENKQFVLSVMVLAHEGMPVYRSTKIMMTMIKFMADNLKCDMPDMAIDWAERKNDAVHGPSEWNGNGFQFFETKTPTQLMRAKKVGLMTLNGWYSSMRSRHWLFCCLVFQQCYNLIGRYHGNKNKIRKCFFFLGFLANAAETSVHVVVVDSLNRNLIRMDGSGTMERMEERNTK